MSVQAPFLPMSNPRDAEILFRSKGKTISIVKQGKATVVTLTFDDIGASSTASHGAIAEPGAAAPIAIQRGDVVSFRPRHRVMSPCKIE